MNSAVAIETAAADAVHKAAELSPEARMALRDLLLTLADCKRLLGIRFSDWMLGAPTLEAGIAASSMAQDEWGHGRLTYALLGDFGDDPKQLEHERPAAEYQSSELLDRPLGSWSEFIAMGLVFDTAITMQYEALLDSRYAPAHNRVQKLLDEELFHFQYFAGWARRMAAPAVRDGFRRDVERLLPLAARWFGRDEAPVARLLGVEGLVNATTSELRARWASRLAAPLESVGLDPFTAAPEWSGWDDRTRRTPGGGPDAETLARVRGDKNRAMLMD